MSRNSLSAKSLSTTIVLNKARDMLSCQQARKLKCVLLSQNRDELIAATSRADTNELSKELQFITGHIIKVINISEAELAEIFERVYSGDAGTLKDSLKRLSENELGKDSAQSPNLHSWLEQEGELNRFLKTIIEYAIAHNFSDIQLSPQADDTHIRAKQHGKAIENYSERISANSYKSILRFIKVHSGMDLNKENCPQEGTLLFSDTTNKKQLRVSTLPTSFGEQISIRFPPGAGQFQNLERFGLDPISTGMLKSAIANRDPKILVVGPTCSAKTSLCYTLCKELRSSGSRIITLEDPVEQLIPGASQIDLATVNRSLKLQDAIKSVLRHAPDTIFLGEIRDQEGLKAAMQLSLLGHGVLTTFHGANIAQALMRVSSWQLPMMDLLCSFDLIIALRLVPSLTQQGQNPVSEILLLDQLAKESLHKQGIAIIQTLISDGMLWYRAFHENAKSLVDSGLVSHKHYLELKALSSWRECSSKQSIH